MPAGPDPHERPGDSGRGGRAVVATPASPADARAAAPVWRSRLWRKYAGVMAALCALAIGGFGGVQMAATFADSKAQAARLQLAEAAEVAFALRASLLAVQRQLDAVNALPWAPQWLSLDVRREEFARLLRLAPAVESIQWRDASGRDVLRVSRREADFIDRSRPILLPAPPPASAAAAHRAPAEPQYSGVMLSGGSDRVIDITTPDSDPSLGGSTVVRIGLRALAREMRLTLAPPGAEVYAVDSDGYIALHRDPSVLLSRVRAPVDLAPALPLAGPTGPRDAAVTSITFGPGLMLPEVVQAQLQLPELGWRVVVERPRSEVMAPVWATVRRAAAFLALGIGLSVLGGALLAGRLSLPIRQLHAAVVRVGAGRLDTQIAIHTHDELEELASQFNRMAESLRASYTDLEDKVAARTLDLQRANRHKSEFLASMSHELRTPLNAILGFADVLREGMAGPLSPAQHEFIGDIHASGVHLLALINDVLDLSKIEAGQLQLEATDFSVPETVESAITLVRQRASQRQLQLQVDFAPGLGLWRADVRRFKQVLLNLLSNALKFTPPGGRVQVRAGLDADAAEGLWVSVEDTGIGIAEADHEAVFQEFRQVGGTAVSQSEGTGLGLALARRLVEQHGGRITLRSALGEGACFRFNIPGGAG